MNMKTTKQAGITLFKVLVVNGIMLGGMAYGKQFIMNKEKEYTKEGLEVLGQLAREIKNDRKIRKNRLW